MNNTYCRKVSRGQVWFLVDPNQPVEYQGSVQSKNRPWLVVSNNMCNQSSPTYTIVPLTTAHKTPLPTHVIINDDKMEQTILCEQIRTVSANIFFASGSYYKFTLSDKTMQEVDEALAVQLGLSIVFPNSDRYWESLERLIRAHVKNALAAAKVTPIDINCVATLLDDKVKAITEQEVAPTIAEQVTPKPLPINESAPNGCAPTPVAQEPKQPLVEPAKDNKKSRHSWTNESMREFLDDCHKLGTRAVCVKWHLTVQSVYVNKAKFKKLLGESDGAKRA